MVAVTSLVPALSLAVSLRAQGASTARGPWPAASAESCVAQSGDAAGLLRRAWRAAGIDEALHSVAHWTVTDIAQQNFQSDRPYPPFFSYEVKRELWLEPATGVERSSLQMAGLMVPERPATTVLSTEHAAFMVRDTLVHPVPALYGSSVGTRALNAWAVLHDWRAANDVKVVASCIYRDAPRAVLERAGTYGTERLYIDPESGLPVKLDREEPDYLWGQLHVEYQYQTWLYADGVLRPGAVFRLVDGAVATERIERSFALMPADSAPALGVPAAEPMAVALPPFLQPTPPDTARAGARTMLLANRGYREGAVMLGDTVYLLDATQGDERARADSAWIARLYPRHTAVVVVVTDLAWPHIAGVRFWVARGATIVSHASSRAMLQRVIDRRWTREPDLLERTRRERGSVPFRFVGVRDSLALAGGALRLYPIDGVASEGALMVWIPEDGVLWAGDYVQQVDEPSLYASEVVRAVQRVGVRPRTVVAQHQAPVEWGVVEALDAKVPR
ncbi:MAG TPA: hypothetical protein VFT57_14245 [Gemmatimonadaceae bacterium]|nr:hypothetical protein [Gemmatimonadaceae bacterium]